MNREQSRKLRRDAKKKGIDKGVTELYLSMKKDGLDNPSPPKSIRTGDRVLLDVDKIKNRRNYSLMARAYREFVESSTGKVFTATLEQGNLVSMQEEPRWLFWSGDLIVVEPAQPDKEGGEES